MEDAMLNEKMKSVFARSDLDGTGLVSEDALCKFFTTQLRMLGRDVDTGLLMSIVHAYRCSADPTMIEYISLINNLWPPSEDSDEASAGSSPGRNAGLARQVKESSEAISTESPKRDEAEEGYRKVEEELGGRAGIEKFAAKSQKLEKEVKRRIKGEPWRQDVIFHHEGLQALHNFESFKAKNLKTSKLHSSKT